MLKRILFVTDNCDIKKNYSIKNRDSEGNKPAAKEEMIRALKKLSKKVYCTYSLEEANKYILQYPDTFVVTTYYGAAAADSKSLLPAICKSNNVAYLGADPYTQMICNDKYLSKTYIEQFGLNSIPGKIIYSPDSNIELSEIKELQYPLIVKPNFGGGSNGIMDCSLTTTYDETCSLVKKLHKYQNTPIIVEEYISGYEISFIIIGNKYEILFSGESMLMLDGKTNFTNEIFGLESKKMSSNRKKYQPSQFISKESQEKMFALFQSFDKCEFMRIDCRVNNSGKVYILELSPDCYVGSNGAFYESVKQGNYNFDQMIKLLIDNSLKHQNYQPTNVP